ncbi:MAG TPA: PP2C family protein-serine/threonine phosphatase, partial [Terriglobia bacterium]|nr:PP2C family protein-serine/threonine phosphatase [Terriglobia bacterium]
LFWAMLMKLTPPRRVLLLISIVLLVFPDLSFTVSSGAGQIQVQGASFHVLGGLGLFVLLALELADRVTMKRDLEIAREIQQWLVPAAPPQIPGVDIAFATRPANTVAGDYYDAFLRPSSDSRESTPGEGSAPASRLLLVVADVAGKSVPAALLMATFQASLRTLAATPSSLVELARGLNRYACAYSLGGRRFTTAFLAELDPGSGTLTSVNAGHNAPILRQASGAIQRLERGGLPLGIRAEADYESSVVTLQRGDLLLIFTDGLVEAEKDNLEEYGEPRLLDLVRGMGAGSAAQTLATLMQSVDAFVGAARQHDDVTCLVMWRV